MRAFGRVVLSCILVKKIYQAQEAAAPVLIRRDAAVGGATATILEGGRGLPGIDILGGCIARLVDWAFT